MTTIGLNMLGDRGRNTADFVSAARRMHANYHLVMNNPGLAAEVLPHCRRGLIYRHHDQDDNAHRRTDPREFVRLRHQLAPPGALLYLGNEPYAEQALADWTMVALDECDVVGRKGVILNFPTWNPEPSAWEMFRPLLKRAKAGGHVLGLHEYFDVEWRNSYPTNVGRWEQLLKWPASDVPEIVMTETGCAVGFKPDRGYLWGGTMTNASYAGELLSLASYYGQYGISATVFCMGSETDDWGTFSVREPVIEIISMAQEAEPVVKWTEGMCISVPSEYVNIRSAPSIRAAVVARLFPGDDVTYGDVTVDADGYRWTPIASAMTFYVATLNLTTGSPVAILGPVEPERLVWQFPVDVDSYLITGRFGEARDYGQHEGIDLAPAWLSEDNVIVRAMADGRVESVRDFEGAQREGKLTTGYGCYVRVRSVDGAQEYVHWYTHLSLPLVKAGEVVMRGDAVGIVGSTGNSTGNHVHITIQAPGKGATMGGLANVIDPALVLSELA